MNKLYPNFSFQHQSTSLEKARLGLLKTPHGDIQTPNFIFCATKASIKGLATHLLKELGTEIILANTYHLMLQPGADIIEEMGGLHSFMNSPYPMLTDSGGYQIFAMGHGSVSQEIKGTRNTKKSLLKITESGATFKSYVNGSLIHLTPELSIDIQRKLGADLIVQFDECTPYNTTKEYTHQSTLLSSRWGDRSLKEFFKTTTGKQAIYGVMQGGVYSDLRKLSASLLHSQDFFGTAIGGSLGKNKKEMNEVISLSASLCPPNRPIHLLGIGGIEDIFFAVRNGIDTLDCVSPTRVARHGWAIVPHATHHNMKLNLLNSQYKNDDSSLDPSTLIPQIQGYSRSYIHHLFKARELSGTQILTIHNIFQLNRLMKDIRNGLKENKLTEVEHFWMGYSHP